MLCLIFVSCQHSRFFLNQDLERWKIDGQTLVVFFRTFIILERCAKGLVILRCHPRPNETHVRFVWHLYASPTLYDHYSGVNSCCLACLSRSRSWYYRQPFKTRKSILYLPMHFRYCVLILSHSCSFIDKKRAPSTDKVRNKA